MQEMLNDFLEEAMDIIAKTNDLLAELKKREPKLEDMDALFRWVHTIKGGAGMMEFTNTAKLAHEFENYLSTCKGNIQLFNLKKVQGTIDMIEQLLADLDQVGDRVILCNDKMFSENENGIKNNFVHSKLFEDFAENFSDFIELMVNDQKFCFEFSVKSGEGAALSQKFSTLGMDVIQTKFSLQEGSLEDSLLVTFDKKNKDKFNGILNKLEKIPSFTWLLSDHFPDSDSKQSKPETQILESLSVNSPKEKQIIKTEMSEVVRVPLERVNQSLNSVWEIFLLKNQLSYLLEQNKQFLKSQGELWQEIEKIDSSLSRSISEIESSIMSMRMSSINGLFTRMEKAVRQYQQTSDKEIDLVFVGAETEVDKKLLDILGEPLIHMIRNAMDHGIENPEIRTSKGKKLTGTIRIKAETTSEKLILELSDDGKGIDKEVVIKKAISKGLISSPPGDDQSTYQLLFLPGFSTAEKLTEVSGRGVGMDVVKRTLDSLGGEIFVNSKLDEGTTFHVELPLSMSLVSAVIININSSRYGLPINNLLEVLRCDEQEFSNNSGESIFLYRDHYIPYLDLRSLYRPNVKDRSPGFMLVFQFNDQLIGYVVDAVLKHTEIVVKEMSALFMQAEEVVGVSIQVTGEPMFVFSPEKIFKRYIYGKGLAHVA